MDEAKAEIDRIKAKVHMNQHLLDRNQALLDSNNQARLDILDRSKFLEIQEANEVGITALENNITTLEKDYSELIARIKETIREAKEIRNRKERTSGDDFHYKVNQRETRR